MTTSRTRPTTKAKKTTRAVTATKKKPTPAAAKPKKATAGKKAAPKKAVAKKVVTKKVVAKKVVAKKAVAKKVVAKKVVAKKAVAKKVVAKKTVAPSTSAKKAASQKRLHEDAKGAAAAAHSGALVNHVVFVVDRSGSMSSIRAKVVDVFNAQLAAMKKNSEALNQQTFVSFYTFHSVVDAPRFFAQPIKKVGKLTALSCTGLTALFDATGQAIVDLDSIDGAKLDNVSFLIIVLTDGHENHSRRYKAQIKTMIQRAQATGRWTFAFLTPKGGEATLQKFGIPGGNIQTWQTTSRGLKTLDQDMQRGLQTFYQAREKGQRAVVGVFTTNLKDVSTDKVSTVLSDVSAEFARISVSSAAPIRPLVESTLGSSYQKGHGYYELTKPELVQEYKELAIVDKATDKVYSGDAARTLLGLPIGERIKLKPGDHGGFAIFVQSTSVNRVLVAGTTLLYKK